MADYQLTEEYLDTISRGSYPGCQGTIDLLVDEVRKLWGRDHDHEWRWSADCTACNINDSNWRRQMLNQADCYRDEFIIELQDILARLDNARYAEARERCKILLEEMDAQEKRTR